MAMSGSLMQGSLVDVDAERVAKIEAVLPHMQMRQSSWRRAARAAWRTAPRPPARWAQRARPLLLTPGRRVSRAEACRGLGGSRPSWRARDGDARRLARRRRKLHAISSALDAVLKGSAARAAERFAETGASQGEPAKTLSALLKGVAARQHELGAEEGGPKGRRMMERAEEAQRLV